MSDLFKYPDTPGVQPRDTSHAAADAIAPKAPLLRARALDVLERSNGLTADQVAAEQTPAGRTPSSGWLCSPRG